MLGECSKGCTTVAAGRNHLHSRHNVTASLQQVSHAYKIFDANNERHCFGEEAGTDGLLGHFDEHKEDTSFTVWQATPLDDDIPGHERTANAIFNEQTMDGTTTQVDLSEMCREVLAEHRREIEPLQLREDQNLFIACAWMTNKERRLFRLFHEVIKVDVVNGTNNEDRPLLTVSVRTSQGKYVVVCRMLLSNERKISFRWAFSNVLPALVGW